MVLVKGGLLLFQVGMLEHHVLAAAGLLGLSQTPWGQLAGGHMLPFFQPKKSIICSVGAPPSAALVELVHLKLKKV